MRDNNDPFEQLTRLFDQTRRSMWHGMEPFGTHQTRDDSRGSGINPTIEQTDDGYVVMADLPGFEKEDLSLRFEDDVLTIRGETSMTEDRDHAWSRRSRQVHEQVALPTSVVDEEITANYHNGVLEVHLPTEETSDEDDEYTIEIE